MAPSFTAYGNLNPAFRLYKIDPETYDILDIHTYYVNLMTVPNDDQINPWELLYKTTDIYGDPRKVNLDGSPFLSPQYWHQVTEQLLNDSHLFSQFWDLRSRNSPLTPIW